MFEFDDQLKSSTAAYACHSLTAIAHAVAPHLIDYKGTGGNSRNRNYYATLIFVRIVMHQNHLIARIIFCLFSLLMLTNFSFALTEREPNNTKEQANLIQSGDTVTGLLQDQYDHYKVTLPSTGRVVVTVAGCPRGGQVQVGATGFGYTGWQDSNGSDEVTLSFEAKKQTGIIWVMPTFAGSVCGSDWCAARFTADGPYHVTKPSPEVPASHQGTPVLAAAQYSLTLRQSRPAGQIKKNERSAEPSGKGDDSASSAAAGDLRLFREQNFGYSFKLPASFTWNLLPDNDGYLLAAPQGSGLNELVIIIQAVSKADNPGSSAVRQLQEAKQQIMGLPGGEIRSEDRTEVADQAAPYFLATYPARTATKAPTTFGHLQMILDHDPNYYWISYSAPFDDFQKHQNVFAGMISTFRFIEPAPPH